MLVVNEASNPSFAITNDGVSFQDAAEDGSKTESKIKSLSAARAYSAKLPKEQSHIFSVSDRLLCFHCVPLNYDLDFTSMDKKIYEYV